MGKKQQTNADSEYGELSFHITWFTLYQIFNIILVYLILTVAL